MNRFLILIILFLPLFVGCAGKSGTLLYNGVPVDLDQEAEVSLSDFVENVELVSLDPRPEALISALTVASWTVSDNVYFLDRRTGRIKVFTQGGTFLEEIDKSGRGPGEFVGGVALQVNESDATLQVLSAARGVYKYSLKDGHPFLNKTWPENGPRAAHHFLPLDDKDCLFFSASDDARLYYFNSEENLSLSFLQEIPRWFSLSPYYDFAQQSPFYLNQGEAYFYTGSDGSIYHFNRKDRSLEPYFAWDFGKYALPADLLNEKDVSLSNPNWREQYEKLSNQYILRVSRICETSRYVLAGAYFKQKPVTLFYDKKTQKSGFFNTTKEGIRFYVSFAKADTCYALLSPEEVPLFFRAEVLKDPATRNVFESLTEESNSVLVRYMLKK